MIGNKIFSLQVTRVIASVAIVFIGAMAVVKGNSVNDVDAFTAATLFQNILNWAVPLFVMVSGTLLLDSSRKMTYEHLFKDYVLKVGVAIVVFNFINSIFDGIVSRAGVGEIFGGFIRTLFGGGSWPHMWYMYMLLAMYLTLPLFRIFVKNTNDKTYAYMLEVLLVTGSILPMVASTFGIRSGIYLWVNSIWPFYFLMGYMAYNRRHLIYHMPQMQLPLPVNVDVQKYLKYGSIGLSAFSLIYIIVMSLTGKGGDVSGYGYFFTVILSVIAFVFINTRQLNSSGTVTKLVNILDECTWGVYLFHMLYLKLLFLLFDPMRLGGFGFVIVFIYAAITYAVCVVITYLLRRVKALRKFI